MNKTSSYILGAIIGDVIGSRFEFNNYKDVDFELFTNETDFTDDSVLTFATMSCIIDEGSYTRAYQSFARRYPGRGYGGNFSTWIHQKDPQPYDSWGNGSAMRVSPVGWAFNTLEEVLENAKKSAEVTHDHPEGIKGAQAVASAIFLARTKRSKAEIKKNIENTFHYDLNRTVSGIRDNYYFNESCQKTVPEAIIAFLESTNYESAIRLAISLGGDSDTLACITGSIAEAFYQNIPGHIIDNTLRLLPKEFIDLLKTFSRYYRNKKDS
jgi:ADP-ribosylglycohydrolase